MKNFGVLDWIVAMGGGSPIDAAKAVWIEYEYPKINLRICAKFLACPSFVKGLLLCRFRCFRYSYRGGGFCRYHRLRQGYQVSLLKFDNIFFISKYFFPEINFGVIYKL